MAEPTPASGNAPLTAAEQKTLDDLTARKAASVAADAERSRVDKLAKLTTVDALVKLVQTDKIAAAVQTVLDNPDIDFDTKQKVQNFKASIDYNIGSLATNIAALSTPVASA